MGAPLFSFAKRALENLLYLSRRITSPRPTI